MTPPPERPKIYHITHVGNLARIVADGCLLSDRRMIERGGRVQTVGMSKIKKRRVEELELTCHPGTKVGDYVPFYFCPRSVMLFVIHCANHIELSYRAGQGPIVHLEADLRGVIRWAEDSGIRWAFSLSNAGAYYTEFRSDMDDLEQLSWEAIGTKDFRDPEVKERKQAEFLIHERFPFDLIERIGVASSRVREQASAAIAGASRQPAIEVRPDWYF